jgi:hypothetical protein
MTDAPDFEDIMGEETESSSTSESTTTSSRDEQIHIKGRFGTTLFRRDEGCQVCGRKADLVLLTDVIEGEVEPDWDRAIPVCESHEGDIRGDVKYGPNLVQRREF